MTLAPATKKAIGRGLRLAVVMNLGVAAFVAIGVTGQFLRNWLAFASYAAVPCCFLTFFATHKAVRLMSSPSWSPPE